MADRPTKVWEDDPSTATPLSAAGLIDAEDRFFGYTEDAVAEYGVVRLRGDAVGNNSTDDAAALQAVFDANRSANLWMEGENRTYRTAQPLILGPSQKLRHCKISAHASYAPVDTPMLTNAQGGVLSFTADVGTDVIATPSAHGLPADDILVMFKGAALPGGLAANTYYYVRDRTSNTFKVSATAGGAAVDITSAGSGGTVYLEVGSLQKVYIDDVYLDGGDVAATGARFSLQQQSILRKLRCDSCTSTGLHLSGQQAIFENFEAVNNGSTGLWLDNASFMYFHGFNVEGSPTGVYVGDDAGLFGGGAFSCLFSGVHIEQQGLANAIAIELAGQHDQLVFDNVSASLNVASQKMLYQYSGSVSTSGYTLRNVKVVGGALPAATMIQDDDRGITLNAWDDFRYRIEEFHAPTKPTSDAYTDPGPLSVVLPAGGYIRYGATMPTVPKMDFRPSTGQTGAQTVWRNTGGTAVADIDPAGKLTVPEFKLTGASPGVGKVLTSDADGDASWETSTAGSDFGLRLFGTLVTGKPIAVSIGIFGGTGAFSLDRVYYLPWLWVDRTRSFDQFEINVSAFAASSTVRFGLYSDNGGRPGARITDYGTASTDTSNGIKTVTAALTNLAAAAYWVACVFQGGTPTVTRIQPVNIAQPTAYADSPLGIVYEDAASGNLPATATPQYGLLTNWPAVCVRTA